MVRGAIIFMLLATSAPAAIGQTGKPTLVSLDYCADQFALGLADRTQILALSKDAEKPFSHQRAKAIGIPKVRASAEDVIALKPDIVLRSWGGDVRALQFYERFGIETVQIGYASNIDSTKQITRDIAAALGQPQRAEALIAAMPDPQPASGISAIYLTPGGVSAGEGTMVDSIIEHSGLNNAATRKGWHSLPLESLVMAPPSRAVTAFFNFDTDTTDAWSISRHPVMQRILAKTEITPLTESRLTCPTWLVADEAAALAEAVK